MDGAGYVNLVQVSLPPSSSAPPPSPPDGTGAVPNQEMVHPTA